MRKIKVGDTIGNSQVKSVNDLGDGPITLTVGPVATYTDWDKEFNLLSEYLEYRIDKFVAIEERKRIVIDMYIKSGHLILDSNYTDPLSFILTFEEWKYWMLYRHEPWEFYNRYYMPSWTPLITKEEWDNTLGFIILKTRRVKQQRDYLPVTVRIPLLFAMIGQNK